MSEFQSLINSKSVETETAQMSYIAVWNIYIDSILPTIYTF